MTPHEAQALVIAAVGDLPTVRRIDYVIDAGGEGVVVEVEGGHILPVLLTTLAEMTVDEYRQFFLVVQRHTERQTRAPALREAHDPV